jgi:hypothetical protein
MKNYIIQYKNSLSENLCDKILDKFNSTENKSDGVTIGGLNKEVKNTKEVYINYGNPNWAEIEENLHRELNNKVSDYINKVYNHINDKGEIIKLASKETILTDNKCFQIQKYEKNVGFYKYHSDNLIEYNRLRTRHITFLWYLNTVEEGGETEFWGYHRVKPEKGKLVLFPACWTYPHTGLMPISEDKYIITGWLYKDNVAEKYVAEIIKEQPLNSERIEAEIKIEDDNREKYNNNKFL